MRQLNFKAIAAVGAIDQQGILKALYTCDSSVNVDRFIEFLKLITPAEVTIHSVFGQSASAPQQTSEGLLQQKPHRASFQCKLLL